MQKGENARMNKLKWYQQLLIIILIVIFSPLIILGCIFAGIYYLFQMPKNKKEYKCSSYFKDFKKPFYTDILISPEYRFYNSAIHRKLPIKYIKQKSNGFEYFIFNDTVFLFPDFDQIDYNNEKAEWQVYFDGTWVNFDESYQNLLKKLDSVPKLPVKLLVERAMFCMADLKNVDIPECIRLTLCYEEAFENDDPPLKMVIPQNTKELYEMMLETPDLCGKFELTDNDGTITWYLYGNIKIEIGVDPRDCYIGIDKMLLGKVECGITHWHPTQNEIYDEVCRMGRRGNVLIIRTSWLGAYVLYMGNKDDCPYSPNKKYLFRKLYYLEAK